MVFQHFVDLVSQRFKSGRNSLLPTSSVEDKFDTKSPNELNAVTHSLLVSRLSFYDAFDSEGGVPGYRLCRHGESGERHVSSQRGASGGKTEKRSPSSSKQGSSSLETGLGDGPLITVCAFTDDGTRLVICYTSGEVIVWDTDHGNIIAQTTELLGSHVLAVSFAQSSESSIQIITQDCTCQTWDLFNNTFRSDDISTYWKDLKLPKNQVKLHTADFFNNGTIAVFSSILDSRSDYRIEFVVAEISFFPSFQTATKLEVAVRSGSIVLGVEVSLDGEGVLVGIADKSMESGTCFLWPLFKENSTYCAMLDRGTLGSWSPRSDLVVTWTVPDGPNPEENDGSSAFVWNVKELRNNMDTANSALSPTILESPFGEKVLWCRLVLDLEENDRLIMALIGTTIRFLFFDVHLETHTHTIATGFPTKDMMLASTKAWIESRVEKKSVKGLSPMAVTTDTSTFGVVTGSPSQCLIYDAMLGIQSLKLSSPRSKANEFMGDADIMFSPINGKIAMVGPESAMIFAPSTPSHRSQFNKDILETPMIEFETAKYRNFENTKYKLLFSGDGDTLGVLLIGSCEMNLHKLAVGGCCVIRTNAMTNGGIVDYCVSMDGEYVVTNTDKMMVYVWRCINEEGEIVGIVRDTFQTMALGIHQDTKEIVVCSDDGSLIWYACSEMMEDEDEEDLPFKSLAPSPRFFSTRAILPRNLSLSDDVILLLGHSKVNRAITMASTRDKDHDRPTFNYTTSHQQYGFNIISCRISANCERAVRLVHSGQLEVWNLKERRCEQSVPFDISKILAPITHDLLPLSGFLFPLEQIKSHEHSFELSDILPLDQGTTILPEREGFIVTDCYDISRVAMLHKNSVDSSTPFEESLTDRSSSIYVMNFISLEHSRQLKGINLLPRQGLAMSADGRYVACLSGKFVSKVVVWSAYASQNLLPDYHSLSLVHKIKNKSVVQREINKLLQVFDVNFVNFKHPNGMTILTDATIALNKPLLDAILEYGFKNRVKLSLLFSKKIHSQVSMPEYHNGVEAALHKRSPEIVKNIMHYLVKRITHEAELDSILTRSFIDVQTTYFQIFNSVIHKSALFNKVCQIEAPSHEFSQNKFLTQMSPFMNLTAPAMKKCWDSRFSEAQILESEAFPVTTFTLPMKNACQFGEEGLLRHVLLNKAHRSVFTSFPIRAIVKFKWKTYARNFVIQELCHHLLIAIAFTIYCFLLWGEDTYYMLNESSQGAQWKGKGENSIGVIITLVICWILAVPCLLRELNQCMVFITMHRLAGLSYWLKSGWNWIEVLSYFYIVVLIPLEHIWSVDTKDGVIRISAFAAIESLLLWSRMLFYAQPFKPTGTFVIVISSLASEVLPLILLGLCVMFGFGVAFHVLYRHVSYFNDDSESHDDTYESMHRSFGSFGSTMYTLFGYLFGEFAPVDIRNGPSEATSIILFISYMVVMAIILLNMLIAVMGESLQSIKSSKQSQFSEAQAKAIDDIDSMLSTERKMLLREKIDGYLNVVVPTLACRRVLQGSRVIEGGEVHSKSRHDIVEAKVERALTKLGSILLKEQQSSQTSFKTDALRQSLQNLQVRESGYAERTHLVGDNSSSSDESSSQPSYMDSGSSYD